MTAPVSFDEYQVAADRTRAHDLSHRDALAMVGLGIAGEGGECADHLKKHLFHGHPLDKDKLKKEIGDVMWYLAILAQEIGLSFSEVAEANVAKLRARYPEGFTTVDSIARRDGG
ncbi:MAG TPA: nucleoside triphosphate pyrophosphohydrolase family protein [Thermoanaerobaculia bacterium]|nr:nucleoside triphosphate pyrophosphohydrolase family protein [Thermoanaerobaculia bacterium]